jgi:hypothetical protein
MGDEAARRDLEAFGGQTTGAQARKSQIAMQPIWRAVQPQAEQSGTTAVCLRARQQPYASGIVFHDGSQVARPLPSPELCACLSRGRQSRWTENRWGNMAALTEEGEMRF